MVITKPRGFKRKSKVQLCNKNQIMHFNKLILRSHNESLHPKDFTLDFVLIMSHGLLGNLSSFTTEVEHETKVIQVYIQERTTHDTHDTHMQEKISKFIQRCSKRTIYVLEQINRLLECGYQCTRIIDYPLKKAKDFILNYVLLVLWCLCDCIMLHLRCNCYYLLHLHLLEFGYEHLHKYYSI